MFRQSYKAHKVNTLIDHCALINRFDEFIPHGIVIDSLHQTTNAKQKIRYIVNAVITHRLSCCPICGCTKIYNHGSHTQKIKDIPYNGYPVIISLRTKRYGCRHCGKMSIDKPAIKFGTHRMTHRLVDYIVNCCNDSSNTITGVARDAGLALKTVYNICDKYL